MPRQSSIASTVKRYTLLLAALAASPLPSAARGQTALDTYVAAPDAYSSVGLGTTYSLANTVPGSGYTGYVLDMTSQVWRTTADVNRTDWQHWLTVITPDVVTSDRALLFITGGSNRRADESPPAGLREPDAEHGRRVLRRHPGLRGHERDRPA